MRKTNEEKVNALALRMVRATSERRRRELRDAIFAELGPYFRMVAIRRAPTGQVEDHAQECALYLTRVIDKYTPERGVFMQFVEGYVGNEAKAIARRMRKRDEEHLLFDDCPAEDNPVDDYFEAPSPEDLVLRFETERATDAALEEVWRTKVASPLSQSIWFEHLLASEPRNVTDIAREHGVSQQVASYKKKVILDALRGALQGKDREAFA